MPLHRDTLNALTRNKNIEVANCWNLQKSETGHKECLNIKERTYLRHIYIIL
jgi:hypothetical protein